jgi:tetratricopeptide (TPR) repeat protein
VPWVLTGILLLTFLVYLPSLANQLTNWDDNSYLLNSPWVHDLSFRRLAGLFSPTTYVLGNYHPLTLLSYALEWYFFGSSPLVYHVTNLLLHLVNTLLVWRVIMALTEGNARSALVTAALFALHPMHVESVAWVSERKDVLHTAFFLGSLELYLRHAATGLRRHLAGSLVLFLLSLLAKGQAVVLPVVMLLADAYRRRPPTRTSLLEKAPFFVLALVFGVLAVIAQRAGGNVHNNELPLWQSPFFAACGLLLYLVRFVVPAPLSAFHPYPAVTGGIPPLWVLGAPFVVLAIAILVHRARSKQRDLAFGILFFALTIAPVLQFLPVGRAIVAERYTYVPYIGLCWVVGQAWTGAPGAGGRPLPAALRALIVAGIACFALLSGLRTRAWRDGEALWTDVLAKYPSCTLALFNRSSLYMDLGRNDAAATDAARLVALRAQDPLALNQYGAALNARGRYREAVSVLDRGVAIDSTNHRLYVNRGVAYAGLGMDAPALRDLTHGLRIEPTDSPARLARGNLYADRLQRDDLAAADFAEVVAREPEHAIARCNLGLVLYRSGRLLDALEQLNRAAESAPRSPKVYQVRARVWAALGDSSRALSDVITMQSLGDAGR